MPRHRELLNVVSIWSSVEVEHSHRHERLTRQDHGLAAVCAMLDALVKVLRLCIILIRARAIWLSVHSRAVARAAGCKALNSLFLI